MREVIVIIVFVIGVLCVVTNTVIAQCNCEPNLTVQDYFNRSDEVFVGKVVTAQKTRRDNGSVYDVAIKFEVTQTWKRDLEKFVTVNEISGSTDGFEADTTWLLYASKGNDGALRIVRNCCSRTKILSVAIKQGDLIAFKKMGLKPKKIIGSN